jgi:hypothetical protein
MLTFENLKEFFILFFTFGIIYLFQYVDDKKRCKKRDGIYDNVKLPLLASAIVGLVLFWNIDSGATFMNYTPAPGAPRAPSVNFPTSGVSLPATGALRAPNVNFPGPTSGVNLPASGLGTSKVNPDFVLANQTGGHMSSYNVDCAANNLEVYTDFPEW